MHNFETVYSRKISYSQKMFLLIPCVYCINLKLFQINLKQYYYKMCIFYKFHFFHKLLRKRFRINFILISIHRSNSEKKEEGLSHTVYCITQRVYTGVRASITSIQVGTYLLIHYTSVGMNVCYCLMLRDSYFLSTYNARTSEPTKCILQTKVTQVVFIKLNDSFNVNI